MSSIKSRKFFFAISRPSQWESCISIAETCPGYAYIKHDKDEGNPHYHFFVEFTNPRSLHAIADMFGLPDNMIENVRSQEAVLQYLTHSDSKSQKSGKHVYSKNEIVTNLPDSAFTSRKMTSEVYDLIVDTADRFLEGEITRREMMIILKPFFYDIAPSRLLSLILMTSESRNGGLSTVPSSSSKGTGKTLFSYKTAKPS